MTRVNRWMIGVLAPLALVIFACSQEQQAAEEPLLPDELLQRAQLVFKPLPETALNPDNPATEAKIDLGRQLYFDTRLSKKGNISCDSCHSLATFGVDNLATSPGDAGQHGGRNSPTVLNAALHTSQFWDGRALDVEEQAGMPVLNPVEMAIPSEAFLVERLAESGDYPQAFAEAFPEDDPPLTYANIRNALAAFERTLLTPSRFDLYVKGESDALSVEEKAGLKVFMTLGCTACHNGVTVGGHAFRKFGLNEPYWVHTRSKTPDEGRFLLTGDTEDRFVFKIASLRNVEKTGPYFHDGSVATLEEAIRVMAKLQVGAELSENQTSQVAAFLRTLTGELPPEVTDHLPERGAM